MSNAPNPEPLIQTLKVKRLGNGWYSFKQIEQHNYIIIDGLNCGTDKKAIDRARRLADDNCAKVIFN